MPTFTEPVWGEPEVRKTLSVYNRADLSVVGLYSAIVQLIRRHFSSPYNIVDPRLRGHIYVEGSANPRLEICAAHEDEGKAPCRILVYRGALAESSPSVPSNLVVSTGRLDIGGTESSLCTLPFNVSVRSDRDAELEILSEEVFSLLQKYSESLRQDFGLFHVGTKSWSELKSEPVKHCSIQVLCQMQWNWAVSELTAY